MRVMVTGGAGFIGGHLVDAFLARGDQVSILDNLSTGVRANVNERASLLEIDLRDEKAVQGAFAAEPPQIVIHLAAQADVRRSMDDPIFDAGVNVLGTIHVLEAARRYGTERIVFASTGGAIYGEPTSLPVNESTLPRPLSCYGASKAAAEQFLGVYALSHGLRVTVLRYANVYGPRQNPKGEAGVVAIFSLALLNGTRPTIFGDGSKTRDYVFIEDVVRANLLAVEREVDGVYNIGTGERTTDLEVFEAVRAAAGANVEPIFGMRRRGEVEHIALDATHAHAELGWSPSVDFRTGAARAFGWYRAQRG